MASLSKLGTAIQKKWPQLKRTGAGGTLGRQHAKHSKDSLELLDILSDPVENLGKTEYVSLHRARDKCVSIQAFDLNVKAVASQENISSSKCDALVTVKKSMVVDERFHQSSSLSFDRGVIASLRTKNGGLHSTLIADTIEPAEDFD